MSVVSVPLGQGLIQVASAPVSGLRPADDPRAERYAPFQRRAVRDQDCAQRQRIIAERLTELDRYS